MKPVLIRGGGPSAMASALLFSQQGYAVSVDCDHPRRSVPLVLNAGSLRLLVSIFGRFELPGTWFQGSRVAWEGEPVEKPGLRVTIGSARLSEVLQARVRELAPRIEFRAAPDPCLTIQAERFLGPRLLLGQRHALVGWSPRRVPMMEVHRLPGAWLMTAPDGERSACVVVVPEFPGDPGATFVQALQAAGLPAAAEEPMAVPSAPSLASPVFGSDWVAVGDGAVSADPLCGDGVALALRSVILAAAAWRRGRLDYYESRLREAFAGHLAGCHLFYRQAPGFEEEVMRARAFERGTPHPREFGLCLEDDRLVETALSF